MEIKGQIEYTLMKHENGDWEVHYERTVENEMVAISIAQQVVEHSLAADKVMMKTLKGKDKKSIQKQSEKFTQARFGLMLLCDRIFSGYEDYKANQKRHEENMKTAEMTEKDAELLKGMMDKKKGI